MRFCENFFIVSYILILLMVHASESVLECKITTLGTEYNGVVNVTVNGRQCKHWDSPYPHGTYYIEVVGNEAENFCRNPDGTSGGPWCYTMDPDVRWEYCPVPQCVVNDVDLSPSKVLYTVTETTDNVGPITCTAVCIPDCTMTWDGPNLLGGTTSVLDLQNINKNQAGDYQCTAINSIGSRTSDIVTVIVNYSPDSVDLSPSTSSYTVQETTDSVGPITCTADCNPDCAMTWSGPNLPGGTTSVLDLQNINRNQTGNYQCTASNSVGSLTSNQVTVIVKYAPDNVDLSPSTSSYTVTETTDSVGPITCTADCVPSCTMTWSGPNLPGGTTSVLDLQNINRNQTGNYQCTASNSIGSLRSNQVTVTVNYAPDDVEISPSTSSYTVLETTDSVGPITCTADCNPDCTMTWSGPNLPGGTTSVLDLQNINRYQTGNYQCTASNSVGSLTSVIVTVIVNYATTTVQTMSSVNSQNEFTTDNGITAANLDTTSSSGSQNDVTVVNYVSTIQTETTVTSQTTVNMITTANIITSDNDVATSTISTESVTESFVTTETTDISSSDNEVTIFATSLYRNSTDSSNCVCRHWRLTREELQKTIEELKKELTIDKKSTSAYIRSITCARDNRKSAVAIGYSGVLVLCVPVVLIVGNDVFSVYIHITKIKIATSVKE